jgi:hypothetical protein
MELCGLYHVSRPSNLALSADTSRLSEKQKKGRTLLEATQVQSSDLARRANHLLGELGDAEGNAPVSMLKSG